MVTATKTEGSAGAERASWRDRAELVFVAIALVVLWIMPHSVRGDGELRYLAVERLLTGGGLSLAKYSIVGPLFAAPLWWAGRALGLDPRDTTAYFNVILFTAFVVAVARELRAWLPRATRGAFLVLLAYGSMFTNHVQLFYGEVFTAVTVSLGVLLLARGANARGWTLVVLGVANTPAALVGSGLVALAQAWRTKRWRHLLAPAFAFALIGAQNVALRGGFFDAGYEGDAGSKTALPYTGLPGFSYPFFFGVLSLLLAFGKGLVFFTPGVFFPSMVGERARAAGVPEPLRWAHGAWLAFVVGLLLVYARWWSWQGGGFWGPRFFLVASVPGCLALAVAVRPPEGGARARSLAANVTTLVAVLLTMWVGANGLVFDETGLDVCRKDHYWLEAFCNYVPEMSALWHPFVDFASSVPARGRPLAIVACGWWTAVTAWLVAPLARTIGAQVRALGRAAAERVRAARSELRF